MTKQYLSIPVQYNTSTQLQADDIKIPVEILVMHDKLNLNNSNFEFEVIDADVTKESIKNIPILGYIKKVDGSDSKDFAGHEIEVVFKDGDIKIVYLERPIGVVPETNNYEYIEKDGKKYVKVIGYLWRDYMNDGYDVLQENPQKSVSMEIVIDAYEVKKNGIIDIKAYRYTGITVLGDSVNPGMVGANMQVIGQFSDNQKFSQEFYQRVEQLNKELSSKNVSPEGGEIDQMTSKKEDEKLQEKLKLIAKHNLTVEQLNFKIDDISLKELESKLKEFSTQEPELSFSATYNQKREALRNALDPIIIRNGENKIIEETYFWVSDFDDEYVYVEKDHWTANNYECSYGRVKYTFDETAITATVDMNTWENMVKVWLTEAENQKIQEERNKFEIISTELETLKSQITEYENKFTELETIQSELDTIKTEFETLTTENNQLKEFKQNIEFKIEIENKRVEMEGLIEEFESVLSGNEEFEQIKNDITDDEKLNTMEYNTVETKLYAIVGKVKFEKKKKDKIKKNVAFSRVNVETNDGNNIDDLGKKEYGEASKYFPKKN